MLLRLVESSEGLSPGQHTIEEYESLRGDLLPEQSSGHLLVYWLALKVNCFLHDEEVLVKGTEENNIQTHIRPPFRKRVIGYVGNRENGERGKRDARKRMKREL